MIPALKDWARRMKLSPSKLMIPLSYAAILGGMCTLIGTSTNLVVAGLVHDEAPHLDQPGIFDVSWVGIPAAVAGMAYVVMLGPRLLPSRASASAEFDDPREYTVEMLVPPDSPLIGKSIEQANLRHLPGLFLIEIDRVVGGSIDLDAQSGTQSDTSGATPGTSAGEGDAGEGGMMAATISPVGPHERLYAHDRLIFAGVVESIRDLQRMRGLVPANEQVFKLGSPRHHRRLFEVVVSPSNPIIGKTIREGGFRSLYQAAILAVAREGRRLPGKIGDIKLRGGDTLLIEAGEAFLNQQRLSRDFFLVSSVADSQMPRGDRAPLALVILAGMVALAASGTMSMLLAALVAAGAMVATRCCSGRDARASVDWSVLIVIAAALAIGRAMQVTGAAATIAEAVMSLAQGSPLLTLIAVFVLTNLMTELITNVAAVSLTFPIALAASAALGVNFEPFVYTIMVAGSASFSSPIGYQTNLMVMGPGGYRFRDYLAFGLPLNLTVGVVCCTLCPLLWKF